MVSFKRITELAQQKAALIAREGDNVVDATAGNGHDTVFLAKIVGPAGHVSAFDIQEEAMISTAEKLKALGLSERVTLIRAGHEKLLKYACAPASVVMYNLGYLPGGDKQFTTEPETTWQSIEQALQLLMPGGIITIVLYPGHEQGKLEKERIFQASSSLDASQFSVLHTRLLNQKNEPPELLVIQKVFL